MFWQVQPKIFKQGILFFKLQNQHRAWQSKKPHILLIAIWECWYTNSGQLWVLEAVQPVKYTPFQQWVNRGVGQRYTVKRLYKSLNPAQQQKLQIAAEQYLGQSYDLYFEWSDRSIYCSEIVWKAYNQALNIQLAPLQQLKDFDLSDPSVKKLMQQRYGKNIPLQEKVISPDALFHSKYLITVKSK
ncbi:hypothetical protein F960_02411 [Acinetobacter gerneri DSM 14967 = CIP 107464 = MTCC 9824]|uniref:Peptidoglycan peptidase n=1 Tax=Acinetobacter gerneri DSM 14967 = CIP 107464 = MTCC 9824 TaxID=1120926 RepID=N8ZI01_9GAMM|nr:hypothetical protein F960_02411 [Acinetobacter gerneri DSM 14967 = CIP 107464 = MTCC 9824]